MKKALFAAIGLLAVAAITPTTAGNGPFRWKAHLAGYNEDPSVSTSGAGSFAAKLDGDEIQFELRYGGLESAPTAAHIHLGQARTNGGVIAFLCGGGSKPACPAIPATVTGTIVAADVLGPAGQGIDAGEFADLVKALSHGAAYVNVHSADNPSGEIRGQVLSRGFIRGDSQHD